MPNKLIIAIDGPAGSGKSTVSKTLAKKLNLLYVDTGAMYRALTLKAIRERVNVEDEDVLVNLARSSKIDRDDRNGTLKVYLDGEEVSGSIRDLNLTKKVMFLAKVPGVRKAMAALQRSIAEKSGAVLEGRDIGTVVFPDAPYKFYLDADMKERVKRRYKEFKERGKAVRLSDVENDVLERDKSDMTRSVAPLKKAKDAVYIDTTGSSVEEVVNTILNYIWSRS